MNKTGSVIYPGRDLEAMSFAVNYHKWILRLFKSHIGSHVVEVGAGTGSFSELLMQQEPVQTLSLIEPSQDMYAALDARLEDLQPRVRVATYNTTFRQAAESLKGTRPDTIIYVNVLEHIADDAAELAAVHDLLEKNGKVLIFVPALRWLYSAHDKNIGHFRRYAKHELETKCRRAGFEIVHSTYFDFFGVVPWWVNFRLLRASATSADAVKIYDRYVVSLAERIESAIEPPVGKNVLLVAKKT